jgi:hypothetical protein
LVICSAVRRAIMSTELPAANPTIKCSGRDTLDSPPPCHAQYGRENGSSSCNVQKMTTQKFHFPIKRLDYRLSLA